jgi:hypothetical protein
MEVPFVENGEKMEATLIRNGAAERMASSQGDTIAATTPPKNDTHDETLYSGDRTVIFVGTTRLLISPLIF